MDLLLLLTCLLAVTQGTFGYETYYVERDCKSGNLTILLSDAGLASAVLLRSTERSSYSLAVDCRITLFAPDHYSIVVSVREIGFRTNFDGTCQDYLKIQSQWPLCAYLFRNDEERHFYSTGNTMEMLYHVSKEGIDNSTLTGHPGIKLTVTAFTKGGECADKENWFRCRSGLCIWSGLRCDSHNNCGDLSDEQDCGSGGGSNSTVLIILGALILLLLLIMCIATLLCSKNETVRRFSNRLRSRTLSYIPKFSK